MPIDLRPFTEYRVSCSVLDTLPIGTFLIKLKDHRPALVTRLVKPNDPTRGYTALQLSPDKRLLYYFWTRKSQGTFACKKLGLASITNTWQRIVQPGEEGFDLLDAFKIACDHRRGLTMSDAMLRQALGLT